MLLGAEAVFFLWRGGELDEGDGVICFAWLKVRLSAAAATGSGPIPVGLLRGLRHVTRTQKSPH